MKLHSCWWCYRAISDTHPGLNYLGLDMPLPIAYGSNTPILSLIVVIVDAGTTLVLLATDAFEAYETVTNSAVFSEKARGLPNANLHSLFNFTRFIL